MQLNQARLCQDGPGQIPQREWQKYRGFSLRILGDLEHSGGKTTRDISNATGIRCAAVTDACCRMLKEDLVERVERWGWRITVTGIFLLSLSLNVTTTSQQRHNNATTTSQDQSEPAPPCFHQPTCHIKKLCSEKDYTAKNSVLCDLCVWFKSAAWSVPALPVEKKPEGIAQSKALIQEVLHA